MTRHSPRAALLIPCCLLCCACAGELGQVRDAAGEGAAGEAAPKETAPGDADSGDLPTKAGDPCAFGKCGAKLICMANVCRATCSTKCGDAAPECAANEGCYWETSFSAVCLPGTADEGQACGGSTGVICKPKHMCVAWSGKPAVCMKLCSYGCPSGTSCGDTVDGCKVCHP